MLAALLTAMALVVCGATLCSLTAAPAGAAEPSCENESLRSVLNSLALPECRAYELVSPPYKEGYPVFSASYSSDGNKVILFTLADLAGTPGSGETPSEGELYLGERDLAGWHISSMNPSSSEFAGEIPVASEADSGISLWRQHTLQQSAFRMDLYERSTAGKFALIGPLIPRPEGEEEEEEEEGSDVTDLSRKHFDVPVAATSDYRHVLVFGPTPSDYWPFDTTQSSGGSLYEYSGFGNSRPILVGVNGSKGSTELIGQCGTHLGGTGATYNALSRDGETVFLTVFAGCGGSLASELYARLHGSLISPAAPETVNISASECTETCGATSGKNFEGASEDGHHVFFTSTQRLTDDASDGTASGDASIEAGCNATAPGAGGCNLYEYDFEKAEGTRLKLVAGGEVLGVAGVAEDGSHAYFVSRAVIASAGANESGATPQSEQPNLYVYDSPRDNTRFIGTLTGSEDSLVWSREFANRPAQVGGPEGRFLLFASSTSGLTPDDKAALEQLFEYRAEGRTSGGEAEPAELVRITKGEDGYDGDGNEVAAGIEPAPIESVNEPLGNGNDFKSETNKLNMSVDGKTVFFLAPGELSPHAASAARGCRNLYEFHAEGSLEDGGVHLISDGRDTLLFKGAFCGPQFQGIDATGANVLFTTADPLVPSDSDGLQRDIYDARVGGGLLPAPGGEASICEICEGGSSIVGPGLPTLTSVGAPGEPPMSPADVKQHPVVKKRHGPGGNSRRLARALRGCKGRRGKTRCEQSARRRYGSKANATKSGRG